MDHLAEALADAVRTWDERGLPRPRIMAVAGSGLSTDLGPRLRDPFPLTDFLPFPATGIVGHALEVELLEPAPGRVVLYSRGRVHGYQGHTAAEVVFPVRLARLLGADVLVLTNSAGGLREDQKAGDLVLLSDHINLTGTNPLHGVFPPDWGPQFPDMARAHDRDLRALVRRVADDEGIDLQDGVYCGLAGPSYETPAEVRMLRTLGGDVVGMSTVLEVIAAHHMGMRCAAISLVANPGAGVTDEVLDHDDVLEAGRSAGRRIGSLLRGVLAHPDLLDPAT